MTRSAGVISRSYNELTIRIVSISPKTRVRSFCLVRAMGGGACFRSIWFPPLGVLNFCQNDCDGRLALDPLWRKRTIDEIVDRYEGKWHARRG